MYRASFPDTFKETNDQAGGGTVQILMGISVSIVIAYFLSDFLRTSGGILIVIIYNFIIICCFVVGPTLPPTYQNKQWEADTRAKLIRQKANPIEGISSSKAA